MSISLTGMSLFITCNTDMNMVLTFPYHVAVSSSGELVWKEISRMYNFGACKITDGDEIR